LYDTAHQTVIEFLLHAMHGSKYVDLIGGKAGDCTDYLTISFFSINLAFHLVVVINDEREHVGSDWLGQTL